MENDSKLLFENELGPLGKTVKNIKKEIEEE